MPSTFKLFCQASTNTDLLQSKAQAQCIDPRTNNCHKHTSISMGKGGQQAARAATNYPASRHWVSPYNPLDPKAPKLPTRGEVKAVIPKECFKRSYIKGLSWIFFDLGLAALLVFAARAFLSVSPPQPILSSDGLAWLAGWSLYAFCMGSTMWGCWVIAHELGHGSVFPSSLWNNAFGF